MLGLLDFLIKKKEKKKGKVLSEHINCTRRWNPNIL